MVTGSRAEILLELPEFIEILCCLNGRLQEGALLVSAQGESLQHLVEPDLVFTIQREQEPAELVFKVVHLAKVAVAAVFVVI